jgi:hypothetical protein
MASDQIQNTGLSGEKMLPDNVGNPLPATEFQQPFREWQEAEEIQLRDYLEVILRRKWLIATVLTLVFLSTLIFSLAVTRIYEASAVVEVSQETPHVTTFQEVLGSEIQAREFYETQVELLRSKAMINRVIEELDLVAHPVIRKTVFSRRQTRVSGTNRRGRQIPGGEHVSGAGQTRGGRGDYHAPAGGRVYFGKSHHHPEPQVHVDRCGLPLTGPPAIPGGRQHADRGFHPLENGIESRCLGHCP